MSDDIGVEVHFDPRRGHLLLSCGDQEFVRLRDLIFAEASIPETVGPPASGARHIEIESTSAVLADLRISRRCPVGLLVGLAIVAVLVVFFVGIRTIWLWCLLRAV